MATTTSVVGIFQGEIIIRSALSLALRELREVPSLIDDALASLPQDDITAGKYGSKTIEECRRWFLGTPIPIRFGLSLNQIVSPLIAIESSGGDEAESTIGDVDYDVSEDDPYFDEHGRSLASVHARESYQVVMLVQGEPELLLFLSTLVRFGFLRHKEDLLDARGVTRVTWSMGPFSAMNGIPGRENFFTQNLRINCYVRHSWPVPTAETAIITSIPAQTLNAMSVHTDGTATSRPVTPSEPPGGVTLNLTDWGERDISSGRIVR